MAKTVSEMLTIEQLVEIGDRIHNANEIIILSHAINEKTEEHHLQFSIIGEQDSLAHIIAKQCCENSEFFELICLALKKLDYKVVNK